MWERGWSFIKKAGTIILLSTIFVWFTTYFGWVDGTASGCCLRSEIDYSILATIGGAIAWIFAPLGWGNWQAAVASITGLVAKENIVGTLGILYGGGDGTVYQNLGAGLHRHQRLFLPRVQPAVRSVLRGHRRHQARDEQRQVDLVRHRLSVRLRLCDRPDDQPVRRRCSPAACNVLGLIVGASPCSSVIVYMLCQAL